MANKHIIVSRAMLAFEPAPNRGRGGKRTRYHGRTPRLHVAEEPEQRRAACLAELIAERRITEKQIAKKLLVKKALENHLRSP